VIVQNVQSLAGNHVSVPAPELRIINSSWNINGTASLLTGVTLNVTTVGGSAVAFKLYTIYVQVSCLNANNVSYTCATGTGTITLPANGGAGTVVVPVSPAIDPETTEVHDLSFIVTGTPTCSTTFSVTATPSVLNITRNTTFEVNGTVTKTIVYTGTCPSATISLSAIGKGPGAPGTPQGLTVLFAGGSPLGIINAVTVPPSPTIVQEVIFVQPTTLPGTYQVIETDTSGSTAVTLTTTVHVF
jgi:hypothetical protein